MTSREFKICEKGSLLHGHQTDNSSCGLYAVNSIEHALFGDKLLQPDDVATYRIQSFTRIASTHVQRHRMALVNILNPIIELESAVSRDQTRTVTETRTESPGSTSPGGRQGDTVGGELGDEGAGDDESDDRYQGNSLSSISSGPPFEG